MKELEAKLVTEKRVEEERALKSLQAIEEERKRAEDERKRAIDAQTRIDVLRRQQDEEKEKQAKTMAQVTILPFVHFYLPNW
jgi:molecular chaperone GrpE (heat shock protein)